MFYGQFKTDKYIADFFEPGYVGVCIDVGAARPTTGNNTYYFEKNGWQAYCIEPNPAHLPALNHSRKHVFNFAAAAKDKAEVDFTICTLEGGNQEAVSSLRVDERLLQKHEGYKPELKKTKVRQRSLNSFINEQGIGQVDFISIDTEGTELDVLKGIDLNQHQPKLLVIENNFQDPSISNYLDSFGYKMLKRVGINDFYAQPGATS